MLVLDKLLKNAIIAKDGRTVKALIALGADPDAYEGFAVFWCVLHNMLGMLKMLAREGADLTIDSDNPLILAMDKKHLAVAEYLRSQGALPVE